MKNKLTSLFTVALTVGGITVYSVVDSIQTARRLDAIDAAVKQGANRTVAAIEKSTAVMQHSIADSLVAPSSADKSAD